MADFRREESIRINHQIRSPKIRVVLDDGEMLGVMSPFEALKEAEKRDLDLVEISPKAQPPVCKIMDYGKFKYELKKKNQGSKKNVAGSTVKEVTLGPSTDVHDLNFKMKNSAKFLEEGYRVKVGIRFRGREMAHQEIGHQQMARVVEALKESGAPEGNPKMEGRVLAALFAPHSQISKLKQAAAQTGSSAGSGAASAGSSKVAASSASQKPGGSSASQNPSQNAPLRKVEDPKSKI